MGEYTWKQMPGWNALLSTCVGVETDKVKDNDNYWFTIKAYPSVVAYWACFGKAKMKNKVITTIIEQNGLFLEMK